MAFGDSLTEGVISISGTALAVDLPGSYPTVLRNLLRARYPMEPPTVINAGTPGSWRRVTASGDSARR